MASPALSSWFNEAFGLVAAASGAPRGGSGSSPIVTPNGTELYVTVSIGCATRAGTTDIEYIQRADEALYSAKNLGRNRVVSSAPPATRQDADAETLAHDAQQRR